MGYDPDEAAEEIVRALVAEGPVLGEHGVAELATGVSRDVPAPTSADLRELAEHDGYEIRLADMPRVTAAGLQPERVGNPAWKAGEAAAKALREQEQLGGGPISDSRLAELAGADPAALKGSSVAIPFSYALDGQSGNAKVVLRSPIPTARRFALARLVGDRNLHASREPFLPIMKSQSYRQKLQRAFAAEFLCPFEHACRRLDNELSEESQEAVAHEYQVSPMVVETQLVNKGLLASHVLDRR
jgi:hypothetical protein